MPGVTPTQLLVVALEARETHTQRTALCSVWAPKTFYDLSPKFVLNT